MRRPSVLLLSAALCALGGCSTLGMDSDHAASAPAQTVAPADSMTPDIEGNLKQMQAMRASGDLLGATRIISQLMLVYPDDPRVVGEYGKLLVQENRPADAVQFLHRAIELNPADWSTYSALGVAFDQQANHTDARVAYEKALQLKPGEPAVLNNYGMSRMLAGDPVMARKLLTLAKANGASDPKIDANLALLDKMPASAPPSGVAAMPGAPHPAVAAVESRPLPLSGAHGAPTPLVHGRVVMQEVPVDPLAGPVKPKHAKVAKHHGDKPAAIASAPAPVKKKGDAIPALRMTADAGKP